MLIVSFNRAAKQELFDSSLYYSTQQPGLGERFLNEVDSCVQEIAASPRCSPKYYQDVSRCILPHFPYGIYYRVEGEKIRILAIAHSSRHPDYWKHRK